MKKNEQKEQEVQSLLRGQVFNKKLNTLRGRLPKDVKSIIPYRHKDNESTLRVSIKKDLYYFSIPSDLMMTDSDWERVEELINKKIEASVGKGS